MTDELPQTDIVIGVIPEEDPTIYSPDYVNPLAFDSIVIPVEVDGEICGVPGICSIQAKNNCFQVPVQSCEKCSFAPLGLFIFCVSCLGLAILLGNLLVMAVYYSNRKKSTLSKIDDFRVSLAVADLIAG